MKKLLVWDLDGCLYNYNAVPDQKFYALCDQIDAEAALELFPELKFDHALALAESSFEKHHDCYGDFLIYAENTGRDKVEIRQKLFERYHALLYERLLVHFPDFFEHTKQTLSAFRLVANSHFRFGLLSHSCMKGWGRPILAKMGVLEYFEPELLLGLDDYNFERKFESPAGMQRMMTLSGYAPEQIIFIEDSLRNALPAKQICGVKIAIVDHGAADFQPAEADWLASSPAELLEILFKTYSN